MKSKSKKKMKRIVLVSMSFSFHFWETIRSLGFRLEEEQFRRWKRNPSRRKTRGRSRVGEEIFTLFTPPPSLCAIFCTRGSSLEEEEAYGSKTLTKILFAFNNEPCGLFLPA